MAEIIQRDGTWAFDGSAVLVTPGLHRSVALLRQTSRSSPRPFRAPLFSSTDPARSC